MMELRAIISILQLGVGVGAKNRALGEDTILAKAYVREVSFRSRNEKLHERGRYEDQEVYDQGSCTRQWVLGLSAALGGGNSPGDQRPAAGRGFIGALADL